MGLIFIAVGASHGKNELNMRGFGGIFAEPSSMSHRQPYRAKMMTKPVC